MEREIRLLEFAKIRAALASATVTSMGRELALDLVPAASLELAARWQAETTEAVSLLQRYSLDLENLPDLRRFLETASRGGMLAEEQLFIVLRLLNAAARLKTFFKEKEGFPILVGLASRMKALPPLREKLRQTLDEDGRLRDEASPELYRLRRAISAGERELRERFERFTRNPENRKFLQEGLVTVRGERFVVPVRVEYRSQVPGIVHDQSASGATLFIEPLWAVEASNSLAALRRELERERERILSMLSQWVGAHKEELLLTLTLYAELDFILAKGRLSLQWQCVEPELNDRGYIKISAGRHPLLAGEVVPISLELGGAFRTLVITGPNTGGKTVTLKTVGLFALMAQSGLHLPAGKGTALAVLPRVFADIGDEQDIAQSLSTFSGHLKNIIEIICGLVPGSLVLLDEIGAGTDPTEGAGLAMAILEYLHARGAITVATTHYSQLKAFAYLREGMENASVEFDVATLCPTYQLLVGVPGQSNAFAIASRLGLPQEIIKRGKEFLSSEETRLEEVVAGLVASRKRLELTSAQAQAERLQAQELLDAARREREELQRRRGEILGKARNEALEIVARARREAQQMLKELRKMAVSGRPPQEEELQRATAAVNELDDQLRAQAFQPLERGVLEQGDLVPGMEVYVHSLGQRGTVIQAGGGTVQVQVGAMRIQVNPEDLSPAGPTQGRGTPCKTGFALFAGRNVPVELDLRGLTLDEAVVRVDAYLDEAAMCGLQEVCLIHGKGTGRLRAGLRLYLRSHPRVSTMRTGYPGEGGTGVTVLKLK